MTQVAPPSVAARAGQRVRVQAGLVSMALLGANTLSYVLNVVAARVLAPDVYGALGSLLALVVIGAVPAMGMQTVAALHIAALRRARPGGSGPDTVTGERQLVRTGLGVASVVGLVALAASPALVLLLHLPAGWPVLWLAVGLAPLTMLGVFHGTLQGHQRFGMLALLVGIEGCTKVGGGLVGLVVGRSTASTLAGMAIGSALAATAGWWLCGRRRPQRTAARLGRKVLHATQAILGLVLLVNLDIVLARHNLSGAQAGDYAIGAIITKIAYWLPQAVAVIVLPRFVDERHRRRMVPLALVVIAALDAWVVLATAGWGGTVVTLIGGSAYGDHIAAAWLFALLGSLLALVQLLLYSRIASADRRSAAAVWAAVGLEIVLVTVWLDDSVTQVTIAALTSAALLVLAGMLIEYRSSRQPFALPEPRPPA